VKRDLEEMVKVLKEAQLIIEGLEGKNRDMVKETITLVTGKLSQLHDAIINQTNLHKYNVDIIALRETQS
jgi:hypothetical protein